MSVMLFGTFVVFPLFFKLDLHLGKILDDQKDCFPPLFWFAFLILLIQYLMIIVFMSWFVATVPAECKKISKQFDSSSSN
jgi:hypothetical protein